jgi:hypothetical protein
MKRKIDTPQTRSTSGLLWLRPLNNTFGRQVFAVAAFGSLFRLKEK